MKLPGSRSLVLFTIGRGRLHLPKMDAGRIHIGCQDNEPRFCQQNNLTVYENPVLPHFHVLPSYLALPWCLYHCSSVAMLASRKTKNSCVA